MRHLELWENFNEYWRELNADEAMDFFTTKKRENFSDRQIDIIKNHLGEWAKNISVYDGYIGNVESRRAAVSYKISDRNTMSFECGSFAGSIPKAAKFIITSYDDEYFRVVICHSRGYGWYLCDGFDGLIKFIDDVKSNKASIGSKK